MEETPQTKMSTRETELSHGNGGGKSRGSPSRGTARWNALKHGVLCDGAVLPTEDRAQFEELRKNLQENLKPQAVLEELLVERIAICFWRLCRILRYDFGIKPGDSFKLRTGRRGASFETVRLLGPSISWSPCRTKNDANYLSGALSATVPFGVFALHIEQPVPKGWSGRLASAALDLNCVRINRGKTDPRRLENFFHEHCGTRL